MAERGLSIVVEGTDGTGKSEVVSRLSDRLEQMGRRVLRLVNDDSGLPEAIQEPGGVPIANAVRRVIKDGSLERDPISNLLLFTVSRRANFLQQEWPALQAGIDVPKARSDISTKVYQGYAEGLPLDYIDEVTKKFVGDDYMNPDHTVILNIADESSRQALISRRGPLDKPDTFESRPDDFQAKLRDGYLAYAELKGIEVVHVQPYLGNDLDKLEASKAAVVDDVLMSLRTAILKKRGLRLPVLP